VALALLLQAIAIAAVETDVLKRLLFVALVFCGVYRFQPAPVECLIGSPPPDFAIAANGGPIHLRSLARGEAHKLEGLNPGDAIPNTKNVWRERDDTHLWFLTDRLVWDNPIFFRVFSIGDVVIVGGLVVTLLDLLLPRLGPPADGRTKPAEGPESGNLT
jgi:hypothetical protein